MNKGISLISFASCVFVMLMQVSCSESPVQEPPYITDDTVYFTPQQGSKLVTVFNAGDSEIAVSDVSADWFDAGGQAGAVSVSVDENASASNRTGTFTVVCGDEHFTVTVVQFGTSPDFSSLPDRIDVECSASRIAVGYVVSASELEVTSDSDWVEVSMNDESIIFADIQANELEQERTAVITVSDGDSKAEVRIVQQRAGIPEVSYTFECLPDELSYKLCIDVEYLNGAVDYRMLVLNPSGFSRTDDELYQRLITGGTGDYVFSNDNEGPDGKITFYGFEIGQEFQICVVGVNAAGEFGSMDRKTHTVTDAVSGDGSDKYNSWLGEWKAVGKDGSKYWELIFRSCIVDEVLYMQGWDNIYGEFYTPVYFDKETGNLSFMSAFISYATSGGRPCNVYFLPMYNMTSEEEISFITDTEKLIASASWVESGPVTIVPEDVETASGTVTPEAIGYVSHFSTGYETVSQFQKIPLLPMKMERISTASRMSSAALAAPAADAVEFHQAR